MELAKNFEEILKKLPHVERAIVLSVRPEWVAKILNGEKTIEIRKTAPKCGFPIDVYIYCTKGGKDLLKVYDPTDMEAIYHLLSYGKDETALNGKVVAKFTLKDDQTRIGLPLSIYDEETQNEILEASCLTKEAIEDYGKAKGYVHAWEISDLQIFDEPKELAEFKLKKSPQSWAYVHILKNGEE